MNISRWGARYAGKEQFVKTLIALQIALELEPSIHAGWRPVRVEYALRVDKFGLSNLKRMGAL